MKFDLIVIGGGHAGIEAAYIASKKELKILLITNHLDLIGQMSCNPAIGGIAKGTIVREIDALGGIMGQIIDSTGIHFRMLNKSKGSAVWGPRAQADKVQYRTLARKMLEKRPNLFLLQGFVKRLIVENESVSGVVLDSGEKIFCQAIVLATGTFLDGIAHIGLDSFPSGRIGEPPSLNLAESIESFGIKTGRLKTGTSPRIDGRTVDFSVLTSQPGDENPWPFSFKTEFQIVNKTVCWIGKSTPETHQIIKDNLDRSPLYTGKIHSIGPRYCPSIEDKIVRFGERDGHTLFLEPESLENSEMYLNGLSTSLPFDVQVKMVQSIKGLENARILRPGYGIEYTYFLPTQLYPTLESKIVKNLYFAGQINGTSGYEEAACQGLVAGINATQRITGNEHVVLGRETSYTGVLMDDLVTKGTSEPYRMFTSRAEYRLLLRQDNCDERLMPISFSLGFLEQDTIIKRQLVWDKKKETIEELGKTRVEPETWNIAFPEQKITVPHKALDLLRRPEVTIEHILENTSITIANDYIFRLGLSSDIKYQGFLNKQKAEIERVQKLEKTIIPDSINYDEISGLLAESRQKLKQIQPHTLGQASRIGGVTPADMSILLLNLSRKMLKDVSRETKGEKTV